MKLNKHEKAIINALATRIVRDLVTVESARGILKDYVYSATDNGFDRDALVQAQLNDAIYTLRKAI